MIRSALTLCLLARTASAEPYLTAEEFQAHIGQDTITYGYSSGTEGTADYGPGRTLRWKFRDGDCFNGQWFPRGDEICFAFEDGRLSACWHISRGPSGLQGRATELSSGSTEPLDIFETSRTTQPLACPGPDVGV